MTEQLNTERKKELKKEREVEEGMGLSQGQRKASIKTEVKG